MKKAIILPTVALFVICLVCTALLAGVDSLTAPLIEKISIQTEIESRKAVLSNAKEFETVDNYAVGKDANGKTVGYVFTATTKSYGGDLVVMTGVDLDGKVTGTEILEITDTAGLGMNAQNKEFKNQFIGLVKGIIVQKNSSDHSKNEITALTGATITSNAVAEGVNDALEQFETIKTKGGAD